MPKQHTPRPSRRKSPEELAREAVNAAAVSVVSAGFNAIDELCEFGKDYLKKAVVRGIAGRGSHAAESGNRPSNQ